MEQPSLRSLEGLTDINAGSRSGADMRSSLLRVLTDLYVQKLTHTPDEERHYTELALRLIDSVDALTRAAVTAQLMKHLSPPREVIQRLASDVPEASSTPRPQPRPKARGREGSVVPPVLPAMSRAALSPVDSIAAPIGTDVADELNEIFFASNASERRLILLNLDVVAPLTAKRPRTAHDPSVAQRLEVAALARRREDFVHELTQSLFISREQARRIADDALGEPIMIAAKALSIPRDRLYRILLFINSAVGHSVERVHTLALLYDEITLHAAQDMVAIWQALHAGQQRVGPHQPLLADDKAGAQLAPAARQTRRLTGQERTPQRAMNAGWRPFSR
jgi:hypothetical protein